MPPSTNVLWFVVLGCGLRAMQTVTGQSAPSPANDEALNKFREKYNADTVIRDTEHIKEDLKHLIDLHKDGTISDEQSIFYVIRMHDFDDNNMLDGLELMKMVSHSHALGPGVDDATVDQLAASVDAFLQLDVNQDGFISYPEWVDSNLRSKASQTK